MKLSDSVLKRSFYRGEGDFLWETKGAAFINTRWAIYFKIWTSMKQKQTMTLPAPSNTYILAKSQKTQNEKITFTKE